MATTTIGRTFAGDGEDGREKSRKTSKTTSAFGSLPVEIVMEIFLRVISASTLSQMKCVCKSWGALLIHPDFAAMHLGMVKQAGLTSIFLHSPNEVYLMDAEPSQDHFVVQKRFSPRRVKCPFKSPDTQLNVLTSCNGLFLVGVYPLDSPWDRRRRGFVFSHLYLWNPCTNEYIELPKLLTQLSQFRTRCNKVVYGLGYDSRADDYKVIRMVYYYKKDVPDHDVWEYESDVHVYSLRSNSCRRAQDVPYFIFSTTPYQYQAHCIVSGVFTDGAIHWVGNTDPRTNEASLRIIAFDVASEEYSERALPASFNKRSLFGIGTLGQRLSVLEYKDGSQIGRYQVHGFAMEKDGWKSGFLVSGMERRGPAFRAVATVNGNLLVLWGNNELRWYQQNTGGDVKNDALVNNGGEKISLHRVSRPSKGCFRLDAFWGSLVSLHRMRQMM